MSRSQRELKAMRQAQREEAQRRQRARDRRNLIVIVAALALVGAGIFLVAVVLKNQLTDYVKNLAPKEPRYNEVKLVMTPYQRGMEHKIALVAWDRIEWLDSYDQNAITRFYELYV